MKANPYLSKEKALLLAFAGLAALLVGLAIAGAFRSYSPVPFWDMWNGYLGFFEKISDGNWSAWWAQHNEHRIVLARLLFWADLTWFGGAGWFLIAVNYILVAFSALVFWKFLRDAVIANASETSRIVLGIFLTAWLFLWSQENNMTWGFQSQFILAQLLPLCALYWLHKSVADDRGLHFMVACVFGVASVGTMANGTIALPLMTLYAILTRQRSIRAGMLAVLSAVTLLFYFYDYRAPGGHGSLAQAFKENPLGLIQYLLLYLGSPFHYLFGQEPFSKLISLAAGVMLVSSSAWFAIKSMRRPREATLQLALLFFILYIGGTALATAGGRLIFGVDHALSSRYTTPALMAWAALLILFAHAAVSAGGVARKKIWIPVAATMVLMIPLQLKALQARDGELFERSVAVLALELRIKDQRQVAHVFPSAEWALSLAEQPSARNLSVFGMYPYQDVREKFDTSFPQLALPACMGSLDGVEAIDGDARFVRVSGWMFNSASKSYPTALRFLNGHGKMVGYAVSGHPRLDVANAIDKKALQSGYRGYLLSSQIGMGLTLQGEYAAEPTCQMQASVPLIPFSLSTATPSADRVTITSTSVLAGNGWSGSDFSRSAFYGMKVYGSLINSDADVGSLFLRIKRGDRIFYRSGPTGGHQQLEIAGGALPTVKLPVSVEWALLEFSSEKLPDGEFTIKFSDDGLGWGEWSAIAIKD